MNKPELESVEDFAKRLGREVGWNEDEGTSWLTSAAMTMLESDRAAVRADERAKVLLECAVLLQTEWCGDKQCMINNILALPGFEPAEEE